MSKDRSNGLAPVRGCSYGITLVTAFFWVPLCFLVWAWAKTGSQYVIVAALVWIASLWYSIVRMAR